MDILRFTAFESFSLHLYEYIYIPYYNIIALFLLSFNNRLRKPFHLSSDRLTSLAVSVPCGSGLSSPPPGEGAPMNSPSYSVGG